MVQMLDWLTGKKVRLSLSLSPASVEALDAIADHTHLNRSEVIEHLTQGRLTLHSDSPTTCFKATPDGISLVSSATPPAPAASTPEAAIEAKPAANPEQGSPSQDHPAPAASDPSGKADQLRHQIHQLTRQITNLQSALTQAQQAQSAQQAEYATLAQQSQQQQQQIEALEQQVDQLRAMATIGESITSRWQRQNYTR